jgi:hypothetical protein
MELFAGAIGYFKSPGSHREVELTAIDAAETIMLSSRKRRVPPMVRATGFAGWVEVE